MNHRKLIFTLALFLALWSFKLMFPNKRTELRACVVQALNRGESYENMVETAGREFYKGKLGEQLIEVIKNDESRKYTELQLIKLEGDAESEIQGD